MRVPPATIQRAKHLFLSSKTKLSDQFGLCEQIADPIRKLPEFLFVGSTNVGKSSLISALLDPPSSRPPKKGTQPAKSVPRVSKWAGFTTTMSVYTVGRLIHIVDSPGYGYKSSTAQGQVIAKYLDVHADLIRQAYVLIHAKRGVGIQDKEVSAMLAQYGIPFQFVVTKSDLNRHPDVAQEYREVCADLHVPPAEPILETSTKDKYGIDELRGQILQLSGILEARK